MPTETLFERMRNQMAGKKPTGSEIERLSASIIQNLTKILNSQQGGSLAQPNLGLPDLNSVRYGEGLDNIRGFETVIEQCIKTYEPRCSAVKVSLDEKRGDRTSLSFKVNLSVVNGYQIVPLVFETVMGLDGKISVEHA